jgi:hypothetical protein
MAKRFLTRLIYSIMALQLLLCVVDRFPFLPTLLGIFSHFVYLGNMRRFPFVKLTDPLFLASCGGWCCAGLVVRASADQEFVVFVVLVLLNHYVWFKHFSHHQERAYQNMTSYYDTPDDIPSFTEIASYFGLCVWLVPFSLFVSLSASDNVLPTMGSEPSTSAAAGMVDTGNARRRGQGLVKALVDSVRGAIGEVTATFGWKKPEDRL